MNTAFLFTNANRLELYLGFDKKGGVYLEAGHGILVPIFVFLQALLVEQGLTVF